MRWYRLSIASYVASLSLGCAPGLLSPALTAATQMAAASQPASTTANAKLMLFGGTDHRTYLGCLNCSQYASDALGNAYSPYGSAYSATSILNHLGAYGSAYSDTSPCNAAAQHPPVIVDQTGRSYGYLTLNPYFPGAVKVPAILQWLNAACSR